MTTPSPLAWRHVEPEIIPRGVRWPLRDALRDRDVEALLVHEVSPSIIPPYASGSSVMRRRSIIDLGLIASRPMSRLDGLRPRTMRQTPIHAHHMPSAARAIGETSMGRSTS